jgi:hypothetical protein
MVSGGANFFAVRDSSSPKDRARLDLRRASCGKVHGRLPSRSPENSGLGARRFYYTLLAPRAGRKRRETRKRLKG